MLKSYFAAYGYIGIYRYTFPFYGGKDRQYLLGLFKSFQFEACGAIWQIFSFLMSLLSLGDSL